MFGQIAVDLGIPAIIVVPPAGAEQEIHDVQSETGITRSGFLVEQTAGRRPADVTILVDASLEKIGVDLHEIGSFANQDCVGRLGDARPLQYPQESRKSKNG